jgi:hypothetical protein
MKQSEEYKRVLDTIEELKNLSTMYIEMHHDLKAEYQLLLQDRDEWKQKYTELYEKTNTNPGTGISNSSICNRDNP